MNNDHPEIYMIKLIFDRVVVSFRTREETIENNIVSYNVVTIRNIILTDINKSKKNKKK